AQEAALRATEYAQPAIGALSVGQFRYLTELGLRCVGYLGHSFGELTALHAAGAVDAEAYFRLARERGLAMAAPAADSGTGRETADRGAMAAVPADRERVSELLSELPAGHGVVVCNHNAPDQVVVGGGTAEVEEFVRRCDKVGLSAKLLPVSAAFHTRFVAHAVERFAAALEAVAVGAPLAPVYANTRGVDYGPDGAANRQALARQLLEPVEFVAAVEAAYAAGCDVFVEFGPKQVLTQLVRRILPDAAVVAVATDAGPLGNGDVALKQAAVQLAVLGLPVSGINRHQADPVDAGQPALEPARSGTVTLSAPEYVAPARREAYQAALSDGYQVCTNGFSSGDSDRAQANGHREFGPVAPAPSGVAAAAPALFEEVAVVRDDVRNDLVSQHLDLHGAYLTGQLDVANRLVEVLRDHQVQGRDQPEFHQAVALVA
nr:acyltransferase domain-containing protein [Micromonospora sp. DSM 115978]